MKSIAKDRKGFERNFNILSEFARSGRLRVGSDAQIEGVMKVRALPNKRIDFHTVNESARLFANTVANFSGQLPKDDKLNGKD